MLALFLGLFGLLSRAHGFNVRASARPSGSLQPYRTGAPRLAVDEARLKLIKGGLPQKFAERVSFQSSGQRQAGQEEEILILWREFKKCYPSEKVALQMLSKNTAVILPQLNSPRKIKGTYALLQKRLGKAATFELLLKNPGVLVCSPEGLAKLSDKVGGKARTRMMHVACALALEKWPRIGSPHPPVSRHMPSALATAGDSRRRRARRVARGQQAAHWCAIRARGGTHHRCHRGPDRHCEWRRHEPWWAR